MTATQNFKMQGCVEVLCEQCEKLSGIDRRNLPNAILENLMRIFKVCHNLLDEVSNNTDITDEYIANLRHRIGDLVCNVAMVTIQVNSYRKGEI